MEQFFESGLIPTAFGVMISEPLGGLLFRALLAALSSVLLVISFNIYPSSFFTDICDPPALETAKNAAQTREVRIFGKAEAARRIRRLPPLSALAFFPLFFVLLGFFDPQDCIRLTVLLQIVISDEFYMIIPDQLLLILAAPELLARSISVFAAAFPAASKAQLYAAAAPAAVFFPAAAVLLAWLLFALCCAALKAECPIGFGDAKLLFVLTLCGGRPLQILLAACLLNAVRALLAALQKKKTIPAAAGIVLAHLCIQILAE